MTTQQFIEKCITGNQKNARRFQSVYYDGETVYSYGYHYPLLVKHGQNWLINDTGYSITTAKHINWAYGATDYKALPVYSREKHIQNIVKDTQNHVKELRAQLAKVTARGFRKRAHLEHEIAKYEKTLSIIA